MAQETDNLNSPPETTTPEPATDKPGSKFRRVSAILLVLVAAGAAVFWIFCINMPGASFNEETTADTTNEEPAAAEVSLPDELREYVVHLAETIGERNLDHYEKLCTAADYVEAQLKSWDYNTTRQTFTCRELECFNIIGEIPGSKQPEKIVIVGGHYDSVRGTPGANDNGSGTAAMLALARHFKAAKPELTIRFVGFTNEEPPYFQNKGEMGSWVYAEQCRQNGDDIIGVISLETMGYFTDEPKSQQYPAPLSLMYPSTGNFIGFVSDLKSRPLQRRVIKKFRDHAKIPSEGASLPDALPGVGWSDHWSFWQEGYQGIMVTDTAPFRYPHYHEPTDTPDKIDYERMAKVVDGLVFVIEDLAKISLPKE